VFGALRFALAILVVAGHLRNPVWLGAYAVFAFYTISGYLMCLVLNERYGFSPRGLGAYVLNRFLRIHPPYWFVAIATLVVMAIAGESLTRDFWGPWTVPDTSAEWIRNIGIFGLTAGPNTRLVPPAWALHVELVHYLAIGLLLGRGPRIALVWLAVAIGWHVHLGLDGAPWTARYFPVQAASLPFALGAVIYHYRGRISARLGRRWLPLAVVLGAWVLNFTSTPGSPMDAPRFYANCALSAALVALLATPPDAMQRGRRLDAWLGDLSYPIYLVHILVGFVVGATLVGTGARGPKLFWMSLPIVIAVAWAIHAALDPWLEDRRSRVKPRAGGRG
jgi:peptidoglycan/LPS O-acetylase OafA/YrhL